MPESIILSLCDVLLNGYFTVIDKTTDQIRVIIKIEKAKAKILQFLGGVGYPGKQIPQLMLREKIHRLSHQRGNEPSSQFKGKMKALPKLKEGKRRFVFAPPADSFLAFH